MCHRTMQTFKNHSKYFIITALSLSIIGGVFAQVSIPTGLTNAIQYIRETVWTSNGTDSWLVNVHIDDTNIYLRTGFLYDGTGWNNKALGVDSSGNVVYVDANAISSPLIFPSANYIPKINSTQDGLDISRLYQIGWLIWLNTTNPVKSLDILGNFQVMTQGSSMTFAYQFDQSVSTSNLLSILQNSQCTCDTTNTAAECSAPFPATQLDPAFCVDITWPDTNNPGYYFYDRYENIATGIPDPVLVTSGTSVWIGTTNPNQNYDLHVSWNWRLLVDSYLAIWDVSTTPNVSNANFSFPNPTWPLVIRAQTNNPPGLPRNIAINPSCIWNINNNNWRCFQWIASLWIGTNSPAYRLDVVGWARIIGNLQMISDETLKQNISNITNGLTKITSLQWVSYEWKNSGEAAFAECEPGVNNEWVDGYLCDEEIIPFPSGTQLWFSAQAVEAVMPELVKTDGWLKSVNYNWIIPVLVEAIKEQQTMIQELEWRIYILENGPLE